MDWDGNGKFGNFVNFANTATYNIDYEHVEKH